MTKQSMRMKESASQTAGPYVHIGLTPNYLGLTGVYETDLGAVMVRDGAQGERISVIGRVLDGADTPLKDALVEIWQADAAGLYDSPEENRGAADPNFTGWGRCPTHFEDGAFRFETVKPGRVPLADGRLQAPHIGFWIVARGINIGLHTRLYFADEAVANAEDPLLARVEHQNRLPTLMAGKESQAGETVYRFDIRLQGPDETIFLDI